MGLHLACLRLVNALAWGSSIPFTKWLPLGTLFCPHISIEKWKRKFMPLFNNGIPVPPTHLSTVHEVFHCLNSHHQRPTELKEWQEARALFTNQQTQDWTSVSFPWIKLARTSDPQTPGKVPFTSISVELTKQLWTFGSFLWLNVLWNQKGKEVVSSILTHT